eukprot:g1311.t1
MGLGPKVVDRTVGYWTPHSATVDWCEPNYRVSAYIAEFHNTWSNIAFIAGPALFGLLRCRKRGAAAVHWLCYALLLAVGLGSTWFHCTLQWSGQLFDELPMLYLNATFFYCLLDCAYPAHSWGRVLQLAAAPLLYCAVTTGAYVIYQNYVLFELFYGGGVALLVVACFERSRAAAKDGARPAAALLWPLYWRAIALYFSGFALWNVDNTTPHCVSRVALQARLRAAGATHSAAASAAMHASALMLELHVWWHLLAGLGTYCFIVWNEAHRCWRRGTEVELRYAAAGALPYLRYSAAARVRKNA